MGTLLQDIRPAVRVLWKSPGFSVSAIATLSLGIAATAVLFSILDGAYIYFGQTERRFWSELRSQRAIRVVIGVVV